MNRGGSWNNTARNCRSANRNRNDPSNRNNNMAFRLALARSAAWMRGGMEPTAIQSRGRFTVGKINPHAAQCW